MIAQTAASLPTSTPLESSATPTLQVPATPTPSPTALLITADPASATPAPSETPLPPVQIPYATIQIIQPGALSRVITPIQLHAFLVPGAQGKARVELFGEDGRLIYRKIFAFDAPTGAQVNLYADLDFEINEVAETARLVISTMDEYGRLIALTSEDLILLSVGPSDINPPGDLLAPIVIQQPQPKTLIQGGKLVVSGLVRTNSQLPLLVELIATNGKVVGSRLAGVAEGPQSGHRLFAGEIPYQVTSPTWVRVTVSERNGHSPGVTQLTSVEVLLSP